MESGRTTPRPQLPWSWFAHHLRSTSKKSFCTRTFGPRINAFYRFSCTHSYRVLRDHSTCDCIMIFITSCTSNGNHAPVKSRRKYYVQRSSRVARALAATHLYTGLLARRRIVAYYYNLAISAFPPF